MNPTDRQLLTEAMGEEWGRYIIKEWLFYDNHGNPIWTTIDPEDGTLPKERVVFIGKRTFDNWQDFGDLWNWARKQEWWSEFSECDCSHCIEEKIDPILFPKLIIKWLKGEK